MRQFVKLSDPAKWVCKIQSANMSIKMYSISHLSSNFQCHVKIYRSQPSIPFCRGMIAAIPPGVKSFNQVLT